MLQLQGENLSLEGEPLKFNIGFLVFGTGMKIESVTKVEFQIRKNNENQPQLVSKKNSKTKASSLLEAIV